MRSFRHHSNSQRDRSNQDGQPSEGLQSTSNEARQQFIRASTGRQSDVNPSQADFSRMAYLSAMGLTPTAELVNRTEQTPEKTLFDIKLPNILRKIYSAADNYSNFFGTLRSETSSLTADEASEVVGRVMSSIYRAVSNLDKNAITADGGQFKEEAAQFGGTRSIRKDFDKAVANLSGVMHKISGSNKGSQHCGIISNHIARLISRRDDIGRWDEALGNTLINGDFQTMEQVESGDDVDPELLGQGSTILASQVVTLLNEGERVAFGTSPNQSKANDILENITNSARLLRQAHDDLTERTVKDNALVQTNAANWGAFATTEELQNAIASQKDSHQTFAQLEAMAGNTLEIFDSLSQLKEVLPSNILTKNLNTQIDKYVETFSDSVALTNSGASYYEQMVNEWSLEEDENDGSLVGKVFQFAQDSAGKGKKALEILTGFYLQRELNSMLQFATSANYTQVSNSFETLLSKSSKLGIDQEGLDALKISFEALKQSGDPEEVLEDFSKSVQNIEAFSNTTRVGQSLKMVGFALSTTRFIQGLRNDEVVNVEDVFNNAANAVGVGQAGMALLRSNTGWKTTIEKGLGQASRAFGIASLGIGVVDTVQSLDNKEWADAAIGGMGVVSGALGLMGFGGPAFAVGLAAMALSMHLSKIDHSNQLENEHTEAFLEDLGIPSDVAYHLRNADHDGNSIGSVLQQVMHVSGSSQEAFLTALSNLTQNEALRLAEACHQVTDIDSLPDDDEYSQYAGLSIQELRDLNIDQGVQRFRATTYNKPRSVQGLINCLKRDNIPLPI